MLVLSRKSNQSLIIGGNVEVTVVEIGEDFVRLAVEAPNQAELSRRYPQSLDVPRDGREEKPVIVTLSFRHAAVLDRLRRQMSDDETPAPSRDTALAALLDVVAETDDFPLPRIARDGAVR